MFERLWVYMGYTVHALASSTGDGLYCVQRISLQRSTADVRIDIRPLPGENAPQSRPEDALNNAYACACKAIGWIASTDARNRS
jgi:hypothetical protein